MSRNELKVWRVQSGRYEHIISSASDSLSDHLFHTINEKLKATSFSVAASVSRVRTRTKNVLTDGLLSISGRSIGAVLVSVVYKNRFRPAVDLSVILATYNCSSSE